MHLTLHFLGPIVPEKLEALHRELSTAIDHPAFTMQYHGLGAFPKPKRARVLWIGSAEEDHTSLEYAHTGGYAWALWGMGVGGMGQGAVCGH